MNISYDIEINSIRICIEKLQEAGIDKVKIILSSQLSNDSDYAVVWLNHKIGSRFFNLLKETQEPDKFID